MRTYHVTFIPDGDIVASGKRYEAVTPIDALAQFEIEFPNAVFLYIASSDMFSHKYGY
jgi:hypothetical protein